LPLKKLEEKISRGAEKKCRYGSATAPIVAVTPLLSIAGHHWLLLGSRRSIASSLQCDSRWRHRQIRSIYVIFLDCTSRSKELLRTTTGRKKFVGVFLFHLQISANPVNSAASLMDWSKKPKE